jgi:FkbM family methyltransferase
LNLQEGIDLSIYLLGAFERTTVRAYSSLIKENDTVLDIGANIGAHALILSQLVGAHGQVVAFEPTSYACRKLHHMMELNPELATRIRLEQSMLVASSSEKLEPAIYSSWPLSDADELRAQHRGRLMDTSGATAMTLDDAVRHIGLKKIDFIKLDVDGHELSVLRGGEHVLKEFKPKMLLELAPYSFSRGHEEFDSMLNLLRQHGYLLRQLSNGRQLPQLSASVRAMIPYGSGINVLAEVS